MATDDSALAVEVWILCDRCEDLVSASGDTYVAAQEKLIVQAAALHWYVADRSTSNGESSIPRPNRDLCARCYEAWRAANAH